MTTVEQDKEFFQCPFDEMILLAKGLYRFFGIAPFFMELNRAQWRCFQYGNDWKRFYGYRSTDVTAYMNFLLKTAENVT